MRAQAAIDQATDEIVGLFENRVTEQKTPGTFFAVFGPDGIVLEGGYGEKVLGEGTAPDRDTVFRIASCTKSFTCTMLLILRDRGELNLDAPITDFVPAFRALAPEAAPVTPSVRQLMTMSAGFPTDNPWGDRMEEMTRAELDEFVATGIRYSSTPGTRFEYSNLGYALLNEVIAEVTGRSYIEAMTAEILEPLGLTSTRFDEDPDADIALGYRLANGMWQVQPFTKPGVFSAMGGCSRFSGLFRMGSRRLPSSRSQLLTVMAMVYLLTRVRRRSCRIRAATPASARTCAGMRRPGSESWPSRMALLRHPRFRQLRPCRRPSMLMAS